MKKVLIQLIGGQTLPNIFSLLSVVPDEVVNIYTEKTKEQHEDIKAWCDKFGKSFGLNPLFREYQPVSLVAGELSANIYAILHAEVEKAAEQGNTLVMLNMTGGTKPMAMWAMNHSMGLEKAYKDKGIRIPIFYVDTQKRTFDYFTHPEMREMVQSYVPFSRKLSIKQIAEAKRSTELKKCHADWAIAYPAARLLQQKFADIAMADISFENMAAMAQKPLSEQGAAAEDCEKIKRFIALVGEEPALQASLLPCGLEWKDGDLYYAAQLRRQAACLTDESNSSWLKKKLLRDSLQSAQNFLVGGWWEILVAHAYQKQNPEAEVLWSVETKSGSAFVETDVIAADGMSLTCISCKRRRHKQITQELEQHCTRTELLGGVLHGRIMAVYEPEDEEKVAKLATALRMKVWSFKTVESIEQGLPEPQPEKQAETAAAQQPETSQTVSQPAAPETQPEKAAEPRPAGSFVSRVAKAWAVLLGRDRT